MLAGMTIDNNSLLYCLQLIRSENVGPITFWRLVKKYGSPKTAIDHIQEINQSNTKKIDIYPINKTIQEIETHKKLNIHLISTYDPVFPAILKTLPDCPPVLSVRGQLDSLSKHKFLGIVGARNASISGRQLAYKLADDLSEEGWAVVSGLARGVDTYAHTGALKKGATIAVVAGGVDIIYPPEQANLYEKIQEKGCIVSEMPLGMHPAAMHFPRRNRIISGLSKGVIVVEAALKSGSLITANFALEQGRELFAVPGSPSDPRCKGTNDLLRRGAHIIESAYDVLAIVEALKIDSASGLNEPLADEFDFSSLNLDQVSETSASFGVISDLFNLDEPTKKNELVIGIKENLLMDLSTTPISIEELVLQYECSVSSMLTVVAELELSGQIIRYPNGMISRLNS